MASFSERWRSRLFWALRQTAQGLGHILMGLIESLGGACFAFCAISVPLSDALCRCHIDPTWHLWVPSSVKGQDGVCHAHRYRVSLHESIARPGWRKARRCIIAAVDDVAVHCPDERTTTEVFAVLGGEFWR